MVKTKDIAWLAGFLEGEGSFLVRSDRKPHTPRIAFGTTDQDVGKKAAKLLGVKLNGPYIKHQDRKPVYEVSVTGFHAASWMMTLYVLMGKRRKAAIKAALKVWRSSPPIYVGTIRRRFKCV